MTALLSPLAADIIGIVGSVLFIIGFAYANLSKAMDQLRFNALNFVGAILLLMSLSVHFNLAAFLLEVAWGTIALLGIGRAVWLRRERPSPLQGRGLGEGAERSAASVGSVPATLPLSPALSPALSPEGERETP